jgi:hypothetical protein
MAGGGGERARGAESGRRRGVEERPRPPSFCRPKPAPGRRAAARCSRRVAPQPASLPPTPTHPPHTQDRHDGLHHVVPAQRAVRPGAPGRGGGGRGAGAQRAAEAAARAAGAAAADRTGPQSPGRPKPPLRPRARSAPAPLHPPPARSASWCGWRTRWRSCGTRWPTLRASRARRARRRPAASRVRGGVGWREGRRPRGWLPVPPPSSLEPQRPHASRVPSARFLPPPLSPGAVSSLAQQVMPSRSGRRTGAAGGDDSGSASPAGATRRAAAAAAKSE